MNNPIIATPHLAFTQPAPVSADIRAVVATLGMLAGEIHEEEWMVVRLGMKNLLTSAEQVEVMERRFAVPQGGEE